MVTQLNLRVRFLLIAALLFVAFAAPAWLAVRSLVDEVTQQWTVRYAEQQIRYDRTRFLRPIEREIELARQLAKSAAIVDFARDPANALLEARAIADMENLRLSFNDQSYFVAFLQSGRYYHNNRESEFAGKQYRYTLRPDESKDSWFYAQIGQARDLHLNVNFDKRLGVTKLWINVLIRDGDRVLGLAGTGFDLTGIIENFVEPSTPGVTRFLIDHAGAIQLHRDRNLIDFSSISKASEEQKTIDLMFAKPKDVAAIRDGMRYLLTSDDKVVTIPVEMQGRRYLVGLSRLASIDWYEVTLLDLGVLFPLSQFTAVFGVYAIFVAVVLLLFSLAMNHYVIRPVERLDRAMEGFKKGEPAPSDLSKGGTGEIRSLMKHFAELAEAVTEARLDLESKIRQRTTELDRLTKTDALTGILNRRGMTERLEVELVRILREGGQFGVLLIDVDWFKEVNDKYGHTAGDRVLSTIAELIKGEIRPYDFASRWGGDEFLVLVSPTDQKALDSLGTRLCTAVRVSRAALDDEGGPIPVSLSIGGHLAVPGEDLAAVLAHADQALYLAKRQGRCTYRASGSPLTRQGKPDQSPSA